MKKSLITISGLVLLMGTGVALAADEPEGWNQESFPPFEEVDTNQDASDYPQIQLIVKM